MDALELFISLKCIVINGLSLFFLEQGPFPDQKNPQLLIAKPF